VKADPNGTDSERTRARVGWKAPAEAAVLRKQGEIGERDACLNCAAYEVSLVTRGPTGFCGVTSLKTKDSAWCSRFAQFRPEPLEPFDPAFNYIHDPRK
jgi:hypothetical protein